MTKEKGSGKTERRILVENQCPGNALSYACLLDLLCSLVCCSALQAQGSVCQIP